MVFRIVAGEDLGEVARHARKGEIDGKDSSAAGCRLGLVGHLGVDVHAS